MQRPFVRGTAVLFVLCAATACATIMHGTTQDVGLSSSPTAAKVSVDNKPIGQTPVVANLKRADNHVVRFELDGYQPFEATMTHKVSGWVWGNIVFGGLIGLAVDAISGGLYALTPEQVAGTLSKGGAGQVANARAGTLEVFVVLRADTAWRRIGSLQRVAVR